MSMRAAALAAAGWLAASAQAAPLPDWLRQAAEAPEIAEAAARARAAEARLEAAREGLAPRWQAGASVVDDRPPTTSAFQPSRTRSATLRAGIVDPMPSGDTWSASLTINGIDQRFASPFAAQFQTLNPAWRGTLQLDWRKPLGRGRNRPDWRIQLAQAEAAAAQARAQLRILRRRRMLEALVRFYRWRRDRIQAELARDALKRAQRIADNQRMRIRLGLIERADLAQAEARVAARRLALARAEARVLADATRLAEMVGKAEPPIEPYAWPAPPADQAGALLAIAWRNRPEAPMLQAALDAATRIVAALRDDDRPQADLVLRAGLRSLDGAAAPALGRTLSTRYPTLSIGIELGDAIGGGDRARIQAAEAERDAAQAAITRFRDALRDEIAEGLVRLRAAEDELAAARRRLHAERRRFAAERARFVDGRGTLAQMLLAEGDLARAEHDAADAEAARQLARAQLRWSLALPPFDGGH